MENQNSPQLEQSRVILLVDDEENIIRSVKRVLRRDNYTVFTANSGQEGLEILKTERVGVILSDQRMPKMDGTQFLSEAKQIQPDSIRIILSGFADLESIADAINRGAIYKFLSKPWDDDLLRQNIEEAFGHYELKLKNQQLTEDLKQSNKELKEHIAARQQMLSAIQHIIDSIPLPLVVLDSEDTVILQNNIVISALNIEFPAILGLTAAECLPEELIKHLKEHHNDPVSKLAIANESFNLYSKLIPLAGSEMSRLVILAPCENG